MLYGVIQHKADTELRAKIDRLEFDETQLVTIKIPLNLPYQQNWAEFERYDGDVSVDGLQYKYVMRKVYNDSLVLKCLPNESRKRIDHAAHNYYQLINDLQHKGTPSEKSKISFLKNLVTEFWESGSSYTIAYSHIDHQSPSPRNLAFTALGHVKGFDRPPQA